MSRRTPARTSRPARWWMAGGLVLLGAALIAILALRIPSRDVSDSTTDTSIAQDVNTMLGEKGPAFTLPDASGTMHTVAPGGGRPLVVISHMGFY